VRSFDITLFAAPELKSGRREDGTQRDGSKATDVVWPTVGTHRSMTLDRMCALMTTPVQAPSKFRCPLFIPGKLTGNQRKNSNVEHLSMLVLDVDGSWAPEELDEKFSNYCRMIYSSWSHSPGTPRMRLVLPLTRDVTPEEYRSLWHWGTQALGAGADLSTKDAVRSYLLPVVRDYSFQWEDDAPDMVDPDVVLKSLKDTDALVGSQVSAVAERRQLVDDEEMVIRTLAPGGKTKEVRLADFAETAEPGDKLKCACPMKDGSSMGSAFLVMESDRVRLTCMSDSHGHERNAGANAWSVVWQLRSEPSTSWSGNSADRWVLRRVLMACPRDKRGHVAVEIQSRGWSSLVLPPGCGEVAEAWVTWRRLVSNVVPVGMRGTKLLFYRISSNDLAELTLADASKVVRLAALLGNEWAPMRDYYGLKVSRKGDEFVSDQEAVRRLQPVLGMLCCNTLEEATAGDGLHVTDSGTHVVTSSGTYREDNGKWERVVPPVVGSRLAASRGVIHSRPISVDIDQARAALAAVCTAVSGWSFENQDWCVPYLSAFMFSLPVLSEMRLDPPWLALRAPTRSGKTKLCRMMEGMTGWVHHAGQSTAYALARALDRSGSAVILDDVEGTRAGFRSRDEVMGALRSGRFTRGNLSAQGYVDYILRNPLIHAGIHDPTHDQDRNRFLELRLERKTGHADPGPVADVCIDEWRHVVQWAVIADIERFRDAYDAAVGLCDAEGVEPRFGRNLVPAVAVCLWAGGDWTSKAESLVKGWRIGLPGTETAGEVQEMEFLDLLMSAPLRWTEEDDDGRGATKEKSLKGWLADRFGPNRDRGRYSVVDRDKKLALPCELGAVWYENGAETLYLGLVPGAVRHIATRQLGARVERAADIRRYFDAHPGFVEHSRRVRIDDTGRQVRVSVVSVPTSEIF
jgi:hypothetical protein